MYQYNNHYYSSFSPCFSYNDNSDLNQGSNISNCSNNYQYFTSPPYYQFDTSNLSSGFYSNSSYNSSSPISDAYVLPNSDFYEQSTPIQHTPLALIKEKQKDEIKGGRNLYPDFDTQLDVAKKSSRKRTDFTIEQRHFMLNVFTQNKYPSKDTLDFIANKFDMKSSVIQTWFKNTRSKQKKLTNTKNL